MKRKAGKKELIVCRRCGCELSWRELNASSLVNVGGSLVDNGGYCFICRGEREHRLGIRE